MTAPHANLEALNNAASKRMESSIIAAVKKYEDETGFVVKDIKLLRCKVTKGNGKDFLAGANFHIIF